MGKQVFRLLSLVGLSDTMKKMVEIYSGNEYYYILDGKERGGFSTKEKAKADAKEMNRARKAEAREICFW